MLNHVMIDIETLAKDDDAVILSIGAVAFDPNTGELGEEFERNATLQDQLDLGREIDPDTLKWWFGQGEKAREALFSDDASSLTNALSMLRMYFSGVRTEGGRKIKVWSNGSNFDIAILSHAYKQVGQEIPWHYRDVRDVRTIVDLAKHLVEYGDVKFEGEKHNALADAIHQAKYVSTRWQALKNTKGSDTTS